MSTDAKLRAVGRWIGQWGGIIAAVVGAMLGIAISLGPGRESIVLSREIELRREALETERRRLVVEAELRRARQAGDSAAANLAAVEQQLKSLQQTFAAATNDKQTLAVSAQLAELTRVVQKLESDVKNVATDAAKLHFRLSVLEGEIRADPQEAIAMPLLRKDFENLRQQAASDVSALKAENSRVYDLMRWLIGLMALVSLGLIGTAVGNTFKRESRPGNAESSS